MSTLNEILKRCEVNPKIQALKGKYSGRIWLIGNGVSLRDTPLELLTDEYSFAMNGIAMIYPRTTWRPTFYFCVSSNARHEDRRPLFLAPVEDSAISFLSSGFKRWGWLEDRDNVYWVNVPQVFTNDEKEENLGLWSLDAAKWLARGGTSMYCVMQTAAYLGFTEFYLVGCDLGWKAAKNADGDPNHFDPNYFYATNPPDQEDVDRINREMGQAHRRAKQVLDGLGIKVFNATRGGELETYPRVRMEEIL